MARKRNNIKRRNSTEDERTFSALVNVIKRQKKKILTELQIPMWRRMMRYFFLILLVRWSSAFMYSTEFVPDEAWQSTEVAYYHTFGRGHLTWEWLVGLRNHIYPFTIAAIYQTLKFFNLDTPYMLVVSPRLFQGTLTAIGEYTFFLYMIQRRGVDCAKWCLGVVLTCWFTFYCGARTITNTTEMSLNYIAIYLMEMEQIGGMVGVVALNFLIRPTALVIWIPQIFDIFGLFFPRRVEHRLPAAAFFGLLVISLGSLVDCWVYKEPTLAWLRFLKFNFFEGGSAEFGEHHVLWYFYSGVPSIMGPFLIPLALSLYLRTHQKQWTVIMGFIFCFSLIPHKEIRFLLPLLPYLFSIVGEMLYKISEICRERQQEFLKREGINVKRIFCHVLLVGFTLNFLAAAYFSGFHQGGISEICEYVNEVSKGMPNPHIWVIMQCYSVPIFTYMHNPNASFEYMTCGPEKLLSLNLTNYQSYSSDMRAFVREKNSSSAPFPDFVLCFDQMVQHLITVFKEFDHEYILCHSRPHAQFGDHVGMANVLCQSNHTPTDATNNNLF